MHVGLHFALDLQRPLIGASVLPVLGRSIIDELESQEPDHLFAPFEQERRLLVEHLDNSQFFVELYLC